MGTKPMIAVTTNVSLSLSCVTMYHSVLTAVTRSIVKERADLLTGSGVIINTVSPHNGGVMERTTAWTGVMRRIVSQLR